MIILFPGTVVVYIPYRILEPVSLPAPASWAADQYAAALLSLGGASMLLYCIWTFASVGRGTLAPFDETRKLVIVGLYRYVRNPMYIGVLLILLAEAWFFRSADLLLYAGFCFVFANLLVVGYEENRLRHKYGEAFRHYCRQAGRWWPRWRKP